jgi:hypothetical protein
MNFVTTKPTSAITLPEDDDPYGAVANEGGGQFGRILKYVKGEWSHAASPIALGTEFLALVNEALRGDVRFEDGKPVEQRIGLIREHAKFGRRADLGDMDESLWEKDKSGRPVDPWSPQTYLPLIHCENGDLYCFIFRSAGAKQTFRDLCRAYSVYRKTTMLPVVSLQTDRYNHPDYSWIDIPILKIERWEDSGDVAPDPDGGANAKVIGESKAGDADIIKADEPVRVDRADDDPPF